MILQSRHTSLLRKGRSLRECTDSNQFFQTETSHFTIKFIGIEGMHYPKWWCSFFCKYPCEPACSLDSLAGGRKAKASWFHPLALASRSVPKRRKLTHMGTYVSNLLIPHSFCPLIAFWVKYLSLSVYSWDEKAYTDSVHTESWRNYVEEIPEHRRRTSMFRISPYSWTISSLKPSSEPRTSTEARLN